MWVLGRVYCTTCKKQSHWLNCSCFISVVDLCACWELLGVSTDFAIWIFTKFQEIAGKLHQYKRWPFFGGVFFSLTKHHLKRAKSTMGWQSKWFFMEGTKQILTLVTTRMVFTTWLVWSNKQFLFCFRWVSWAHGRFFPILLYHFSWPTTETESSAQCVEIRDLASKLFCPPVFQVTQTVQIRDDA